MTFRFILIFSLLFQTFGTWAQDSIPANTRARIYFSPTESFVSQIYDNPAINYYAHTFSISELQIGWEQQNANKAFLPQLGSEVSNFSFHAFSYMPLGENSKTWGNAYFKKGKREKVEWNETSDYLTVYPYVVADSVGGDMDFEEYYFAGGYAQEHKRFTWGIYANYRALIEYRKIDPRPRNIVSDLKASIGMSAKLNKLYSMGIAFHAGKYKQTNDVKFYSELGSAITYNLSGLGMDYVRFRRGATSLFYDGHRYGASIEIFPRDKQGFSGSFGYERFSFEKIISDLNDLPLNTLNQDEMKAEIAYTSFRNKHHWGIRTRATYQDRQGIESLIGSATTNVYEKTGEAEQLSVKKADISVSGIYGQTKGDRFTWYLSPRAGFNSFKMEYLDPARLMKVNYLSGGMNFFAATGYKKHSFQFVLDGVYRKNSTADLQLTEIDQEQIALAAVYKAYDNLSADNWTTNIELRWNYSLPKNRGIFIKLNWQHDSCQNDLHRETLQAHCGIVF